MLELKGRLLPRHFPCDMKALYFLLTLAAIASADESADSQAIRKVIATFNHASERASVLARDADVPPLDRFAGQDVSQVYFEPTAIRLVTPDVAFVDASASQFGSVILKRSTRAMFVLKREGGVWLISVMRIAGWNR
jgi:hypothetical protein